MPPRAGATRVRAENARLRDKNTQLRASMAAVRPGTPVPATPSGGPDRLVPIASAADRLVSLLGEGARLLLEREQLQAENDCLAGGGCCSSGAGDVALGGLAKETEDARDLAAIDRLLPLLSESDALRAEREALQADRAELMEALGDACVPEPVVAESEDDSKLGERIRAALADVSEENCALTVEVASLRKENVRLRGSASTDELDALARAADPCVPEAKTPSESEFSDNLLLQQQAMATVLGRMTNVSSLKSPPVQEHQELVPEAVQSSGDYYREEQMRSALHLLYKGFAR